MPGIGAPGAVVVLMTRQAGRGRSSATGRAPPRTTGRRANWKSARGRCRGAARVVPRRHAHAPPGRCVGRRAQDWRAGSLALVRGRRGGRHTTHTKSCAPASSASPTLAQSACNETAERQRCARTDRGTGKQSQAQSKPQQSAAEGFLRPNSPPPTVIRERHKDRRCVARSTSSANRGVIPLRVCGGARQCTRVPSARQRIGRGRHAQTVGSGGL
jgi:hypothetical protein